jgi:ribosome biogenesis GTPase / thiamine phosphate phosphatase
VHTPSSALFRLGWDESYAAAFEAIAPQSTVPARVVVVASRTVTVVTDSGQRDAVLAGRLRNSPPPGGVTTGDWVAVEDSTVHAVVPRRSALLRHAAGAAAVAQAVAANLDIVFIAVPLGVAVGVRRLERTLAMAWSSGARPVVLLTKSDLSADLTVDLASATAVTEGAEVIAVNAQGFGLAAVRSCLPWGSTGAIVGPSGAGKSTLINSLCGRERLATAAVRADGRGRHTTAHRELVELPWGGLLIDTPGMREMGVWDAQGGIDTVFADVGELASHCKFSDCSHNGEPDCAVREAAQADPTVLERLASLRKLEREQRFQDVQVDERLRAQARRERRRWARVVRTQPHR